MKVRDMALCALFAALLAVCAWLCLPVADVAFTMQTFGIFLTLGLLGGKRGTAAIVVYLVLGAVGLPVFSGFQGGLGVLFGVTGGYLAGFLLTGLLYWLLTSLLPDTPKTRLAAMILGMLVCYLFGTLWFRFGYLRQGNSLGIGVILMKCVIPYLLPDLFKLTLAWFLTGKLKRFVY